MLSLPARICPPKYLLPTNHFQKNPKSASLCAVALVALVCGSSIAMPAQTAHFGGVQTTVATGFNYPAAVAVDSSGDIYVADFLNHVAKEIVAVNGSIPASPAIRTLGAFTYPNLIAVDPKGNVYVYDSGNGTITEMLAVNGSIPNSPTTVTLSNVIANPQDIKFDASGNMYMSGGCNGSVPAHQPCGFVVEYPAVNGVVSMNSSILLPPSNPSQPGGIAVDASGNLYVADTGNYQVDEVVAVNGSVSANSLTNVLTTLTSPITPGALAVDASGDVFISTLAANEVYELRTVNGVVSSVPVSLGTGFSVPAGLAVASNGNLYVADLHNNRIVMIVPSAPNFGSVNVGSTTQASSLVFTFDKAGTLGGKAVLTLGATGLDFADAGTGTCTPNNAYAAGQSCILNVTFAPRVSGARSGAAVLKDVNGNIIATAFLQGNGVGPQLNFLPGVQSTVAAHFGGASFAVAVDGAGAVYVANSDNGQVWKYVPGAGGYTQQSTIGVGLRSAFALAVDGAGNVYIVDSSADVVYKETPSGTGYTQSVISTTVSPRGVAIDGGGNVYISTTANNSVLKETLTASGYVQSTVPTNGMSLPGGVAVDGAGNVYVSDPYNGRVLKETLTAGSYSQSILASGLGQPQQLAVDANGNVYIGDSQNGVVLEEAWTGSGFIQSTVGSGFLQPYGVAVDGAGNVYIADAARATVSKLDVFDPPVLTFTSTSDGTYTQSTSQTVTVENVGSVAANFPIPAVANNPSITANFVLDSTGASACPVLTTNSPQPASLTPGASCQLVVDFAPPALGAYTGALVLTDNNLNATAPAYATQSLSLSGTQVSPTFTLSSTVASAGMVPGSSLNSTITVTPESGFTVNPTLTVSGLPSGLTASFAPNPTTNGSTVLTLNASSSVAPGAVSLTITGTSGTQTATTIINLTIQVTPAITWTTPAAITYGTPLSATQLNASSTVPGAFTYSPAAGTVLGAGPQVLTVTFTPTDTIDYLPVTTTVTLTVSQAAPSITWVAPAPVTYGTALGAAQLNASSSVPGTFSYSPGAGTVLSAGSQTLSATFTPTDTTDYTSATTAVTLTVSQASPAVSWATPSAIGYGTVLGVAQLNATASVRGTFAYSPAAGAILPAGTDTLTVTFTPSDTVDYAIATTSVTLTVNKAAPAISWITPAPIIYGTALSATQLDATSAVAGTFAYTPAAGTVLGAGSQPLSVIFTPSDTADYATAQAAASIVVNPATPTITWATPSAIPYGTALSAAQLNASSTVAGTFVYSPAAGTVLNTGTQTLTATFTPSNTTNYSPVTTNVTLTVNKLTPVVSWAPPAAITQGTALSATQLDATASVAGTFVYTPAAGSILSAGSQTLTVNFTPTNTGNYTTATGSVVLTVNPAPSFTLAASPASLSIAQGASGTSTITLSAKNGFSGSASLTASGLPSGVTAAFSTNPVTGSSVLTLTASSTATVGVATVTITGTSGSLTSSTTVALTITPKAGFACHVIYSVSSQWPGGFGTAITIQNTGTTAITNWTLTFTFANGQKVTQIWNGNESQSGANVTVTNMSYDGSIPAGGSYSGMGFNGSWNNVTNAIPTSFSVNGTVCR